MTGEGRPAGGGWLLPRGRTAGRSGMFTGQPGMGNAEAFIALRGYAYTHTRQLADLAATSWRCLRLRRDPGLSKNGEA